MTQLPRLAAVSVNHTTSLYLELMLRSFFATQAAPLDCRITIYDNASTDDGAALRQLAAVRHIPIVQTGFGITSKNNSHGEILRRFVLDTPGGRHNG